GIGSAMQTAQSAADVVLEHGIAAQHFARYYRPVVRTIDRDNQYGYWLFRLWEHAKGEGILSALGQRTLIAEQQLAPTWRAHSRLLWYMFTGDAPYRTTMLGLLSWPSLRNLALAFWRKPRREARQSS
ncbi:MAG: hypothetical protein ACE5HA_09270, partial [Anaerolineae bacterium]